MQQALTNCGWRNYTLFLQPDGLLVGYLETTNFENAKRAMQKLEVNSRWQSEMASFFLNTADGPPDQAMAPLEEIFHLD